ncbi:universal stress protein [Sphingomonas sp.]|uniref:universal stress protein n=1 Tax=Sphingomonas sp. TaxID=28214 RepID=UPI002FCB8AA5
MKSILLYANDDSGFEERLSIAVQAASGFAAHLSCLQVTPFDAFIMAEPFGGMYALATVVEQLREKEQAHRTAVEARLKSAEVDWDWQHYEGQPANMIVQCARLADLVILSLPNRQDAVHFLALTADVALHARTPVLAVPERHPRLELAGPAVVAWNGSSESAHALRSSLPMLRKASSVHIISVSGDHSDLSGGDATAYLARHGITAKSRELPRAGHSVADVLLEAASALNAQYLVAGAYGHTRIREAILGGATRDLLTRIKLPLLLAH